MNLECLLEEARSCRVCATSLPLGPKPVLQLAGAARLLIIGQAPGRRVHQSGVPWDDASGRRLRDWMMVDASDFYDQSKVAILPMGFCYPGAGGNGGDRPPRPECAPLWHERLIALLPHRQLTLLVGQYAQRHYLGSKRKSSMTDTVKGFADYGPQLFPLPHPSWRSAIWMQKHPWFQQSTIPALRNAVSNCIG